MPRSFRARFRTLAVPALALVAAALAAGCGGDETEAAGPPGRRPGGPPGGERPAVPVAVEPARTGPASSYYVATATLEPHNRAEVLSRATGVVREILVEEGDRVRAGAILLRLDDAEAALRVRQAEANWSTAKSEHERRSRMLDAELLSAEEFEVTENTLRVRESELGLARIELDHTRVAAPFPGRVVRRFVDRGANVSPGTRLFELMDVDPLLARVYVPAKRMGAVKVGQAVQLRLDSTGETLSGAVSLISPIVDASTGTVKVTAEIRDYPAGTRPGVFVEVRVVTERHENALLVPSRAILEDQGSRIVYVAADGKAERRAVESGFVDGDHTEILAGLAEGDLVVVKGQRQLRDGQGVEILEGPPDVVAAAARGAKAERDSSEVEDAS